MNQMLFYLNLVITNSATADSFALPNRLTISIRATRIREAKIGNAAEKFSKCTKNIRLARVLKEGQIVDKTSTSLARMQESSLKKNLHKIPFDH